MFTFNNMQQNALQVLVVTYRNMHHAVALVVNAHFNKNSVIVTAVMAHFGNYHVQCL